MRLRSRPVLILTLLAAGAAAFSWIPVHGARRTPFQGVIEPEAVPVISPAGGRIARVLAHRGDRVVAGQLLLRFESSELDSRLARVHSALHNVPDHLVDATADLLLRLPPATIARLVRTDPERIAAEQEYSDALAEFESHRSEGGEARLKHAAEQRKRAYRLAGELRPSGLWALRNLQDEGVETLHWLEAQRARFEIRAPVDGVIELLDLEAGDVVPPMSRLALVDVRGRFVIEARVPERQKYEGKPGTLIQVGLSRGDRVPGVLESIEGRLLRVRVANLSIAPLPGDTVQVFF